MVCSRGFLCVCRLGFSLPHPGPQNGSRSVQTAHAATAPAGLGGGDFPARRHPRRRYRMAATRPTSRCLDRRKYVFPYRTVSVMTGSPSRCSHSATDCPPTKVRSSPTQSSHWSTRSIFTDPPGTRHSHPGIDPQPAPPAPRKHNRSRLTSRLAEAARRVPQRARLRRRVGPAALPTDRRLIGASHCSWA